MSAAEEITEIFKEVINNNLSYCIVCLRTEKERKIVVSESLMGCLGMLRMRAPLYKTLCYVCESALVRALRFIQALHFAGVVNNWFRSMGGKAKYVDTMAEHLTRVTQGMTFGKGQPFEEYWPRLRARTQLSQTEPLLVNSQGMTHELEQEPSPPAPDPPPPSDPSHPSNQVITIPDDEEEGPAPEPPPAAGAYTVHPIVLGQDKVLYIPSLNGKLDNGIFEHVDADRIQQNVIHQTVPNTEERYMEIQNIDELLTNSAERYVDLNGQTVRLKVLDKVNSVRDSDAGDVEEDVDVGGDGDVGAAMGKCESVARQAVMSGKVDWEDKIPMDVISFVDATDPNADQFLTRDPLGDVDPLPFSPAPSLTPYNRHRERRAKKSRIEHSDSDVVIDLC